MWTLELIIIGLMILVNGVFASYEIALASLAEMRIKALEKQQHRGAAAALRMKRGIEASLAVVQLGITLVGAIAAATGGAGAAESVEPLLREWGFSRTASQLLAVACVVAPLTVITIIFGELVPKVFALRNKERVCLALSPAMEWFSYSVWPAVWFLEGVVSWIMSWGSGGDASQAENAIQELHGAAAAARMTRLIGHRQEGIIISASRLASIPVRRIMLPAEHMDMLSADQTLTDALVAAHQNMHTRYPVTEEPGNPQRIIGYVNFKDIVSMLRFEPRDPSFRSIVRRLYSFPPDVSVADCLEHLMRERNHIGLVREPSGQVLGMVTLEDVIEEIVGEIHDEFDRMPTHLNPAGPGWIAGGFVPLNRLREVAGIELAPSTEKPTYTLNDWIEEYLGRPPKGGEEIETDDCRILIRKTRGVLVQEAYLSPVDGRSAARIGSTAD